MNLELIHTKDYLLLSKGKSPQLNDYFHADGIVEKCLKIHDSKGIDLKDGIFCNGFIKEHCDIIIGYYPLHSEAKELEGVDMLPDPFKIENIEDLARKNLDIPYSGVTSNFESATIGGWIQGYEAAQSKQLEKCIEYFNELWKKFGKQ